MESVRSPHRRTTLVAFATLLISLPLLLAELPPAAHAALVIAAAAAAAYLVVWMAGLRWIRNDRVGVVEKLWSLSGSLGDGQLIATRGEAGFQAAILRGGFHARLWPWQYRVHVMPLVAVAQGRIAYVYARDGDPLPPEQTLGRIVACNHFQDAAAFLAGRSPVVDGSAAVSRGQRGRQRAILREGVYAINLAQFVVVTEDNVYRLELGDASDARSIDRWHKELIAYNGFSPVVIGAKDGGPETITDEIGVVTTHDGPPLLPGEIIAPAVGTTPNDPDFHDSYQDVEAFLRAGGHRGRQLAPLVDGTYFINRWFATVERIPKTVVPIGSVGVVVAFQGKAGVDVSGTGFRHGERVAEGDRGVRERTLGPGKYPFNTYAGQVHLVPTTNFVLHWITGRTESHRYDETLKSIDLVTADAYEPVLPLSIVVHIDYEKAPSVVQRFGDVKRLITQTLDPLLSAYFRDIAHKKTMLAILHERDAIQREATLSLRARFTDFDIQLVDVLIGKPDSEQGDSKIETLLEQLRQRQLSKEQVETYEQQRLAAERLKTLRLAEAIAAKQTELTNSQVEIEIAHNHGNADLARARLAAEQTVVTSEAESRRRVLLGEGEARRTSLRGEAQAGVLRQKVAAFSDARLYALSLLSQRLARSRQPLVPDRLFVGGSSRDGMPAAAALGPLAALFDLLRDGDGSRLPSSPSSLDRAAPDESRGAAAAANGSAPRAGASDRLALSGRAPIDPRPIGDPRRGDPASGDAMPVVDPRRNGA